MSLSENELKTSAALAYIDVTPEDTVQLADDVSHIMAFIEQLRSIDTTGISPLLHPLEVEQRLRSDEVTETDHTDALSKIAPLFSDNLYWVPAVLGQGS